MPQLDATKLHGPKHVNVYLETDGEVGHEWKNGAPTLILTTKGRKSGEPRQNALIYGMAGDNPMVVASKGGNAQHPAWYLNLREMKEVTFQIAEDVFAGSWRQIEGVERANVWDFLEVMYPPFEDYKNATAREIPVIALQWHAMVERL